MKLATLSRRSLVHHARAHIGAILGAAVSAAVLIGALVVGDSVRESLKRMALARLGKIESALSSNDRFFRAQLGNDLGAAAVLRLSGSAANNDASTRANLVEMLGVSEDFWKLSPNGQSHVIPPDGALINEALARQLKANAGDSLLLRIQRPSQLSQDAPLAKAEDTTFALRVNVEKVLSDDEFGRFGLAASQIPPFNVFLNRDILQRRSGMTNKANLLVTTDAPRPLRSAWKPADAELDFRLSPGGREIELRTSRVFVDPAVAEAAGAIPNANPILTYFVNELRHGTNATPYSMVTAAGTNLAPNEIVINQWLADDLRAQAGGKIDIVYYVVGPMRRLEEARATFTIKEIVPLEGIYADRTLMPDFPGLTDAENCRDWDTGFPINTEAIRPNDEKYWDDFRGTPKAFISLARGQELWSNRFGNLTSIRWPLPAGENLEKELMSKLEPAAVGLRFEPIRAQALAASAQGQDFAVLFLGFSMFLIASALMLMNLLFGLGVERRALEIGTLLAIGLSPKQIRRLLLFEGAGLALLGTILGIIGGVLYAKAMVLGLSTIWKNAVGTSALQAHVLPQTLAIGALAAMAVALASMAWSLRKEGKRPARELLNAASSEEVRAGRGKLAPLVAIACFVGAIALAAASRLNPGMFFGAGALLLISAVAAASIWMRRQAEVASAVPSLSALGIRNIARRSRRSRAVIILLGSGAFIIASIGAFRLDANDQQGTGGFQFIGESSLPIVNDLNTSAGREFHSLNNKLLTNVHAIPFRVRAGDDASCLNLNKAQRPRLLGVDPAALTNRFRFTKKDASWLLLEDTSDPNVIPAIGDAASIQYALKSKIGGVLDYEDERGRKFKIRIVGAVANSILQGNLVIAERHFIERFPTEAGYRMFLVDAPSNNAEAAGRELTRGLQDYGLQLTPATERLAAFNAVQNTYLSTFQILGGLGLVLGSFGLGVVVLRNVFERRAELAVLQAVGFAPARVRRLILGEHAALMAAGLIAGAAAALVAVLPQLLQPRGSFPLTSLLVTLGAVVVFGLAATWFAASLALRGNLLEALRSE